MDSTTYRAEIYKQDCEFYRYRDKLKWSRLWNIWLVEIATIYALFSDKLTNPVERLGVAIFADILIIFFYWLIRIDELDTNDHLRRLKAFEVNIAPLKRTLKFWRPKGGGAGVTLLIFALVMISNILISMRIIFE